MKTDMMTETSHHWPFLLESFHSIFTSLHPPDWQSLAGVRAEKRERERQSGDGDGETDV